MSPNHHPLTLSLAVALATTGLLASPDQRLRAYGRYVVRILVDPYVDLPTEDQPRNCILSIRARVLESFFAGLGFPSDWPECGWYPPPEPSG